MIKKFRCGALLLAMVIFCTTFEAILPIASAYGGVGNVEIKTLFDRVVISGTAEAEPNSQLEIKISDSSGNPWMNEFIITDENGSFTFWRELYEFIPGSTYSVEIDGEYFGEFTGAEKQDGNVGFFETASSAEREFVWRELEISIDYPITEDLLIEVKRYKSEPIFSYVYKPSEHSEDIEYGKDDYREYIRFEDVDSAEYTLYLNGIEWATITTTPICRYLKSLRVSRIGDSILLSGETDNYNEIIYLEAVSETGMSYTISTQAYNVNFSEKLSFPEAGTYHVKNHYGDELGFFVVPPCYEIYPEVTNLSGRFENEFFIISGEASSEGYIYLTAKGYEYSYENKIHTTMNTETGKAEFERKIYVGNRESGYCDVTANESSCSFYNTSYSASDSLTITMNNEEINIRGKIPNEQQLSEKPELRLVDSDGNVLYSESFSADEDINKCINIQGIRMNGGYYHAMIDDTEYGHFKVPEFGDILFKEIVSDISTGEVRICGTTEPNKWVRAQAAVENVIYSGEKEILSDENGDFELIIPNQQKSGEMHIYINSDIASKSFLTINYTGVPQAESILAEINNCTSAEALKNTIEKWSDIINVNIDKINALNDPMAVYDILVGNEFSSLERLSAAITEQTLLQAIAECISPENCEILVLGNIDLIGIDHTKLNQLQESSKSKVYIKICGRRFKSVSELKMFLEEAIAANAKPGSSSGGGGGSSGSGIMSGYVISSLPSGCYYSGEYAVKLSFSGGDADIYYTTDGSEPSTESIKYTGAIPLTEDITIKAIAVKDDAETIIKTFTYKIVEKIDGIGVVQVIGNSAVLSIGELKSAENIKFYSANSDEIEEVPASFNDDKSMAMVYELTQDCNVYIIIEAEYPDGIRRTRTEWFCTESEISSECELFSFGSDPFESSSGAIIDREKMTVTNIKLPNKYEKAGFYAEVSDTAEYALYPSKYSNTPYENNLVPLKEGKNTFYIKITASDKVTKKVYKVTVHRNTKSEKPQIEIKGGKAYINAAEGAKIYYTTDNSAVNIMFASEYSDGFDVYPGMTIRAIASDSEKDESSDEAILMVSDNDYKAIIDIIDCIDNKNYVDYELNIVSKEETDGLLICAEHKNGKLVGLEMLPMPLSEGDNEISKRFMRSEEASEFKLMLWDSFGNMKPLALPQ